MVQAPLISQSDSPPAGRAAWVTTAGGSRNGWYSRSWLDCPGCRLWHQQSARKLIERSLLAWRLKVLANPTRGDAGLPGCCHVCQTPYRLRQADLSSVLAGSLEADLAVRLRSLDNRLAERESRLSSLEARNSKAGQREEALTERAETAEKALLALSEGHAQELLGLKAALEEKEAELGKAWEFYEAEHEAVQQIEAMFSDAQKELAGRTWVVRELQSTVERLMQEANHKREQRRKRRPTEQLELGTAGRRGVAGSPVRQGGLDQLELLARVQAGVQQRAMGPSLTKAPAGALGGGPVTDLSEIVDGLHTSGDKKAAANQALAQVQAQSKGWFKGISAVRQAEAATAAGTVAAKLRAAGCDAEAAEVLELQAVLEAGGGAELRGAVNDTRELAAKLRDQDKQPEAAEVEELGRALELLEPGPPASAATAVKPSEVGGEHPMPLREESNRVGAGVEKPSKKPSAFKLMFQGSVNRYGTGSFFKGANKT